MGFEKEWLSYFRSKEKDVEIGEYIADILVKNKDIEDETQRLLFNREYDELVIELINSKISSTDILSRINNYNSYDKDVLFILNINKYEFKIEKHVLYLSNKYIIKLKEVGGINRTLGIDVKVNLLLDPGNRYLYYIRDHKDTLLYVSRISRRKFLSQIGKNPEIESLETDEYVIKNKKNEDNMKKINECIELMNNYNSSELEVKNDNNESGFMVLGEVLSILSDNDEELMFTWIDFVLNNSEIYKDIMRNNNKICKNKPISHIFVNPLKQRYKTNKYNYTYEEFREKYIIDK